MQWLSLTAQSLFAELREQALIVAALGPVGASPGSVVHKEIRGRGYCYLQVRDLDGKVKQHYVGPVDDEKTEALVGRLLARRGASEEQDRLEQLRAAFVASGGSTLPVEPFRVIAAFAQSGVLRADAGAAVLIGTHAFQCLGNTLGARWSAAQQTHDVDLAADRHIAIAVDAPAAPAPAVLERLSMGFLPVPALSPKTPSTSYFIRGAELRVDLLTPARGAIRGPVFVSAFQAPAQPLRHLDFLLAEVLTTVALSSRALCVVAVPDPGRLALHKLLVSRLRPAAFATKARKDRQQASQLCAALTTAAPTVLPAAAAALRAHSRGAAKHAKDAIAVVRDEADVDVDWDALAHHLV